MCGSGERHHFGETGRSRRRWDPLPLVLIVVQQRFPCGEIKAPLLAESSTLGSQLPVDEILRFLLVHRTEQIPLHSGHGDTGRHRSANHDRRPQLRYLRQRHWITHSGTHCVTTTHYYSHFRFLQDTPPKYLSSRPKSNWNLVTVYDCFSFPPDETCTFQTTHTRCNFIFLFCSHCRARDGKNKNILKLRTKLGAIRCLDSSC